jgi:hypothetical protein
LLPIYGHDPANALAVLSTITCCAVLSTITCCAQKDVNKEKEKGKGKKKPTKDIFTKNIVYKEVLTS